MLSLAQVESGIQVASAPLASIREDAKIFGYPLPHVSKKKEKRNPSIIVEMERIDNLKPGSPEAIEAMRVAAESDLDLFTGKPGEDCPEACFMTANGIDDAMFDNDNLDVDISLLWGNKLPILFRGV